MIIWALSTLSIFQCVNNTNSSATFYGTFTMDQKRTTTILVSKLTRVCSFNLTHKVLLYAGLMPCACLNCTDIFFCNRIYQGIFRDFFGSWFFLWLGVMMLDCCLHLMRQDILLYHPTVQVNQMDGSAYQYPHSLCMCAVYHHW